ncbi:MAG: PadR family transcriptional regulator [Armatimonadetes bacterium]|nr:PadR family transcriptional regulator [Armatimonadota bacterium]
MRKLSHLAYIALGVIARSGPCTAYAVMKEFRQSRSSYFSGSAGAIYPLVRRLEAAKLIKAERSRMGSRTKKRYSLTEKGFISLRQWLSAPIPAEEVSFNVDLLRSRVFFFDQLKPTERRKFIVDAREKLRAQIVLHSNAAKRLRKAKNKHGVIAIRSVILIDQARLKWLDELERQTK